MRKLNLTGQTFGKLTVMSESSERGGDGSVKWLCHCECGGKTVASSNHLRKGDTRSCGCLKEHQQRFGSITHGHSSGGSVSATYSAWFSMIGRCTNPNNGNYDDYGGRGITVCERWMKFENFLADMGEKPLGLMLDRRNNEQGYYPDNCRWVNRSISNQNRRPFKRIRENAEK